MVWAPVRRRHAGSFPARASARGARRAATHALRGRGDVLRPRGDTGRTHARGRGETRTRRCRVLPRRPQRTAHILESHGRPARLLAISTKRFPDVVAYPERGVAWVATRHPERPVDDSADKGVIARFELPVSVFSSTSRGGTK